MESRRFGHGRRKVGAVIMLMGLLAGLFATLAPNAGAVEVGGGTIGGFEVDGNQEEEAAVDGTLDWDTVVADAQRYDDTSPTDPGFVGSSKENDPTKFSCNPDGGDDPGKADLLRAYVNSRITSDTSAFLDLGFVRRNKDDGGGGTVSGDSHVNFEFNRGDISGACPYNGRQTGDLLLTFDFPGNGSDPAVVRAFTWDATIVEGGNSDVGAWVEFDVPDDSVAAQDNTESITDAFTDGSLDVRTFGEASIDLIKLDAATPGSLLTCPGFGTVSIRSRSSGESFESALQDFIGPAPVDLSTCGDITIHKTDDAGTDLDGATFGLWAPGASVPAVVAGTRPTTGALDTCTTGEEPGTADDGACTFDAVTPGVGYQLAEVSAPTGYELDDHIELVTVGFRDSVDVAFVWVNPRDTGYVDVTKVVTGAGAEAFDAAALDGLRFFLTTDPDEDPVNLWPPTDPPEAADCSLDGLTLTCIIGPVALGDYFVNEDATTLPAGLDAGPAVKATVDEDGEHVAVDYTNETDLPGVSVAKTTSTPTVDAGDGVAFSITLTNDSDAPGTVSFTDDLPDGVTWAIDGTPPTGCALDGSNNLVCTDLVVPAQDSVTIDLTGTSDPTDCPSITNPTFTITVTDEPAELASDNTAEAVTITVNCPDVRVEKSTPTSSVDAGDPVGFDITITNDGPGAAKNVSFTDDLPDGVVWSFVGEAPEGCTLTEANNLSCSFDELADDASVVVHLTGTTDAGDCPSITNPASTVSADNEPAGATGNNTTDPVTITVTCPPPPPPPPPPSTGGIEIVKTGPALAHVGDTITYEMTVTNTGDVDLHDVEVTDPICDAGTLEQVSDGDGDTLLEVDLQPATAGNQRESWDYTCTRVVQASDADPLPNTATAEGTKPDGGKVTDTDPHEVDIIHPAIQIVKTVDNATPSVGQTVTFTYVVTNTGDTTLFDVEVVDDQLGAVGVIDELEAGESATLTKTMVVAADSPGVNIGTATGADVLDKTVTDDDDEAITIVLGEVITPPKPQVLPRTGADSDQLFMASGLLLLLGGLLVASGEGPALVAKRRRR